MKKIFRSFMAVCAVAVMITACQKNTNDISQEEIDQSTLSQIQKLGFSTEGAQKVNGGYLVEGDIILSNADLSTQVSSPNMLIAKEEQYRTFNLVSATKHPTIKVALDNSSTAHEATFSAALDEAIRRYNAEGLTVTFTRVDKTAGPDITVIAYYEVSNTLGSAGFPNSTGDPYPQIKMNTYHYSTSTTTTNTNYIGTIMAHEMGHCIGFRHTDYMDRSFSCGGRKQNEGQSNTGVGAVLIPGTPSGPDAASWMLACIGSQVNRPFNPNDKIALSYVY